MAYIDLRRLLYTPCNKCSKCPYNCNLFKYIVNTKKNDTDVVPIPKKYNKECYRKLEFIKI